MSIGRLSPKLASSWTLLARFLALICVFGFFAVMVDGGKFYTLRNIENILRQSAVYAMAGLGMTFVIIARGIDLSIGSIIALCVVVVAWVLDVAPVDTYPVLVPLGAALAGVAAATLAGLLNGSLIVGLRIAPFIVTLGMMGMIRGLAKGLGNEKDIYPAADTWIGGIMNPAITSSASQSLLPTGLWMLLVGFAVAAFVLRYTRLGYHVFAVGSNEEAARLCGINVGRTKVIVYVIAGCFAGVAGLLQFSYIGGIGQPTTAVMYELFVIAAVIIGGASFSGGEGSVLGTIIGALIITILYMGGQQMGWPKWVQEMAIGAIIIAAVTLDSIRQRRR